MVSAVEEAFDDFVDSGIVGIDDVEQIVVSMDIFAITLRTKIVLRVWIDVD